MVRLSGGLMRSRRITRGCPTRSHVLYLAAKLGDSYVRDTCMTCVSTWKYQNLINDSTLSGVSGEHLRCNELVFILLRAGYPRLIKRNIWSSPQGRGW